ncbi:MAG TPA: hypothetical protein VGJ93_09690 [Desulfuromonadaceae bacterium]|jgi:hypothetical protein
MKAKPIIILLLMFSVHHSTRVLAIDTNTYAAVNFTLHNLRYAPFGSGAYDAKGIRDEARQISANNPNATQVCIFCHTPHNASISVPLWNKALVNAPNVNSYQLYTSSPSLTQHVKSNSKITAKSESLLCLSCHDGKTAINALHSINDQQFYPIVSGEYIVDMTLDSTPFALGDLGPGMAYTANIGATRDATTGDISFGGSRTGTDLTDDHPIGFTYPQVVAARVSDFRVAGPASTTGTAENLGVRFFGPEKRVECSSCHNPHVYYGYGRTASSREKLAIPGTEDKHRDRFPFLVRDNNGSALCLACHIK